MIHFLTANLNVSTSHRNCFAHRPGFRNYVSYHHCVRDRLENGMERTASKVLVIRTATGLLGRDTPPHARIGSNLHFGPWPQIGTRHWRDESIVRTGLRNVQNGTQVCEVCTKVQARRLKYLGANLNHLLLSHTRHDLRLHRDTDCLVPVLHLALYAALRWGLY